MKAPIQLLKLTFILFFFLGALAYTVFSTKGMPAAFDELPNAQTVYNVQTNIPDERGIYFTGAQVVGKLYRLTEDNVPITVEGVTFTNDMDVKNFQNTIILTASYKPSYSFDANGQLSKITFSIQ